MGNAAASFVQSILGRTLGRLLPGKTERRLALVIFLSTMVPLAAAQYLATSMFRQASAIWFNPEIGEQLDRGVDVYKDLVKAIKDDLKHQTVAIASDPVLREAAKHRNLETLESELDAVFPRFPELVSLTISKGMPLAKDDPSYAADLASKTLARRDRGHPADAGTERSLDVTRTLSDEDDGPVLVASFAVPRKRLDELESAGSVVARYHQLEASRSQLYQGYLNAFAALLGVTMLLTVSLGIMLARGVTRRINRLGAAINVVAQGDLSVRVPVTGSDELTDLARTFNRMLAEMAQSRARIEFLQRIDAWQDMAQRLAHEIKNPLTPIQLAVQECHQKYPGDDPRYRVLLDTTLEIVEEEVGTLRRLVSNFSNFARLPNAELKEANLGDFLRDCENQLGHLEDPSLGEGSPDAEAIAFAPNVEIRWEVPSESIRVAIDRQMLRRVIVNLVRNSVQAIRDARARPSYPDKAEMPEGVLGHVLVSAQVEADGARIEVDDDGPGIAESMRGRIFDPYFTTKADGTGLGLAIVKKVVVEHGGEIEATKSNRLGGARFVVHLPGMKILAIAAAAREAREKAKRQGVESVT
ncbi:Nitrogen regulation protein NtrY [Labilithrix luteola]|uniref:Signal transduction histidine-protein kinase/phosphatase MprB n=1 Tax=Labilithrix luteola TaxID=1391654 RepID=A0A0K1PTK8_9BACT|nr:ATP-binding protein [Labilithrix luteola]AKU96873.1 Nitrogen regulation protein NtrY [Labilithrix luteola]